MAKWVRRTWLRDSRASAPISLKSLKISDLGDKLQWLAGADPRALRAIDRIVDAKIAAVLRKRRQSDGKKK